MNKRSSIKHFWPGLTLAFLFLGSAASSQSWTSYTNYNQVVKLTADPVSPLLWGATPGGAVLFSWQDTLLVEKYDNTNGLPNVELTSVTVDRHGDKWFGTYGGGIARLDSTGSSWRVFNALDGLISDTVTALCSYQDYIFAGTKQGLSFSNDYESWPGISNNLIFPNLQTINSIAQRNDTLWVATDVGLARAAASYFISHAFPSWQRDSAFGLSSRNVQCILLSDSSSFIGTMSGADSLEGTTWRTIADLNGLVVRDMAKKGDSLFFATSQGIKLSCQGVWTTLSAGLLSANAYSLAIDDLGRIWCGTELGLAVLQDTVWQPFRFNCLSENNCFRVTCSQDGNPYVIRRSQKEIQYLHNGWWQTYNQASTGMPFSLLERLAIDKYGNLLAGDWGQGLFIRSSAGPWRQYMAELPTNVIKNILLTENGFYLAQWGHDYRDPVTFYSYADTMFHVYWGPIETMRPNALAIDGDGTLWVGTNAAGLYNRKTDGLWQNFNESNSALSTGNPVITVSCDNNGRLWIGTINGLFFYDGDKISPFSHPLLSGAIISIKVDRANNKWIGTDKGLNLITWDGQMLAYTQRDLGNNGSRLLSDNINEISIAPIDDQTDGIYIATEKGLNLLKYNLVLPRQALSVNVAPNPYRPGQDPYFYFSNLPSQSVVRIFTLDGRLLGTFHGPTAPEHILVINPEDIPSNLVSGLYLCHVSAPGFKQTVCKLAVIR
ncbi:MAG: two-component regulator propeller domain-containing protein [bacterium]|nr:two-component regulator propeller domain-containing protein [bacterium]